MFTERRAEQTDHKSASELFDIVFDFDYARLSKPFVAPVFTELEQKLFGNAELIEQPGVPTAEPPPKIAESIAQLSKSDKALDKALAAALLGIFSEGGTDIDTTKESDANTILKLIERNKPPLDKEALLALMTKATYLNGRHAILELNENGKSPKVIETLASVLKSTEPKDARAADSLIFLLSNNQQHNKELSQEIVDMLSGTKAEHDQAVDLLTGPLHLDQMSNMLKLLKLASDAEIRDVKTLLKSSSQKDIDTAAGLIDLADKNYCAFSKVLNADSSDQRQRSFDIVRHYETPDDIVRLLDLSDDPRNHKSIDALLAKPEVGKNVLQLLGSAFADDRAFGNKLFEHIGRDAQSQKDVANVVSINDDTMSKRLFTLLEQPTTARGIRELLEQRDSNNRKERFNAETMLSFILGEDLKASEHLVALLQVDKPLADKLFSCADSSLFQSIQMMLSAPEEKYKMTGLGLLNLSRSGADGRVAAEFLYNVSGSDFPLYESMAHKFAGTKPEELSKIATAIVNTSSRAGAINLLRMMDSPDKKDQAKQTIDTLLKGSVEEQAMARTLLNSFGTEKEPHQNGVILEKMLSHPDEKALAKLILGTVDVQKFDSRAALSKLLKVYSAPEDVPLRKQMSKIAENDPSLAKALLSGDFTRGELGTFLEIYGEPGRATVATVLRQMVVDKENVKRFLDMLDPANPNAHRIGFSLLSMLNKPAKDTKLDPSTAKNDAHRIHENQPAERSIARHLLASNLSDESLTRAKTALQGGNDDDVSLAKHFLNLGATHPAAKDSLNKIYNGLHSNQEHVRANAQLMLKFLEQQPSTAIELFKRTKPGDPDFSKIAQVADTPEKLKAVVEILRLRDQRNESTDPNEPQPADPSFAASAIIDLLNTPATMSDAKFVVDMLAKKETHEKAITLILACGTRTESVAQFVSLLNPKANATPEQKMRAQRLNDLLNNPTQANVQALTNVAAIAALPFVDDKSKKAINEMLCDNNKVDNVLNVLKTFSSPEASAQMLMLSLQPQGAEIKKVLDEIISSGQAIDISRAQSFLIGLSGPGVGTSSFLLPLLRDTKTRDFAKRLIQCADRFDYSTIQSILEKNRDVDILKDLMKIAGENPAFRTNATALLNTEIDDIRAMHGLLKNESTKELGFQIMDLISRNEAPDIILGRQTLLRMQNPTKQNIDFSSDLIKRFRATDDDVETAVLVELASLSTTDAMKLDKILYQPGMEAARDLARQVGLRRISQWLEANPNDAESFWRMMKDPRHHNRIRSKLPILQP